MKEIIRIGMDTSKSVFVLHGVDAAEEPVLRKKLRRKQVLEFFAKLEPTKVGLEPAGARIIGPASCALWATRRFCCRHNMSSPT
jgi:transposase